MNDCSVLDRGRPRPIYSAVEISAAPEKARALSAPGSWPLNPPLAGGTPPARARHPLREPIVKLAAMGLAGVLMSGTSAAAGLFAHWKFDEATGSVAADVTGRFPGELTPKGATFVAGGVSGNALRLDRTEDGHVRMPPLPGLADGDFTVVLWTRLAPGDTTPETFLLSLHEAWYENGFFLLLNESGGFGAPGKAAFVMTRVSQTGISGASIHDGQWHQIALRYQKSGLTSFYVDGPPAQVVIPSIPLVDRNPPLFMGASYGREILRTPKSEFTGWIDDVQVYDTALTDGELDQLTRHPGKSLDDLAEPLRVSPTSGTFVNTIEVRLASNLPGATLRYTVDGSDPTVNAAVYQQPLDIRETTTIKARLFVGEFPVSEMVSATFTRLPAVEFVPRGGRFTNAVSVVLRNHLGLGTIAYTLDGSDPTPTSPIYTGSVTLTASGTIRARVIVNGFPASEVQSATYLRVYAIDDGIPHDWRERYFGANYETDPRVAADEDPDGDGWSNRLEYQSDTHPLDRESKPSIVAGIRAVPQISWNSIPGLLYRISRKSSVNATHWEVIVPAFRASQTTSRQVDADAPDTAIYRIELAP
jgi:hypothetical protein